MPHRNQHYIKKIVQELHEENLAIFAGAGLSTSAGYVDWKSLVSPFADELGLDIDKEFDLIALAQYYLNSNANNRSQITRRLLEEFSAEANETEVHKILARLPIHTFWTTNYDKLIENTLMRSGKIPDIKYTNEHLATTKPKRDVIVYKMHGDIDHPTQAVLTKDDYEKYHVTMNQYISALQGDLISKTFLFIGFSFTDPNLDYILSRVRVAHNSNQRQHYCFVKEIAQHENEDSATYEYKKKKQEFFIQDLERFNIKTIRINEYNEIENILQEIENRYKHKTIFISGAAHEYGTWDEKESLSFVQQMSASFISNGYKIVSGFGLGIGSAAITGALEEIYIKKKKSIHDQLLLRPFPQPVGSENLSVLWTHYRHDMISHAGITILLFGNKLKEGVTVDSNGMYEEYKISKEKGNIVLPIGATGYISQKIWQEELAQLETQSGVGDDFLELFKKLGDENLDSSTILTTLNSIIELTIQNHHTCGGG